jgi:hypothetical protein
MQSVVLTSHTGQQSDSAPSPDAKLVAFCWNGEKGDNFDIYVKLVDAGTPVRLSERVRLKTSRKLRITDMEVRSLGQLARIFGWLTPSPTRANSCVEEYTSLRLASPTRKQSQ